MKHPKSTYLISATEMWGKFSFMLFCSSLVLFTMEVLHFSTAFATISYGVILALCYILQLGTGYLTDRYLGNRKSIIIGSAIIVLSFVIFSYTGKLYTLCSNVPTHSSFLFTYPEIVFLIGAIVFCIGTAFFKVSVTSFLGLFYKGKEELLDSAYTIFYMFSNFGAIFSPIAVCFAIGEGHPYLYQYGFLIGAIVVAVGLISFILLKDKYLRLENGEPVGDIPVAKFIERKSDLENKKKLTQVEKDRVKVVLLVFMVAITFFIAMEQISTSMVLLASDYIDHVVIPIINVPLSPQFYIIFNPLFVTILSLLYMRLIDFLAKRKKEPSSINKLSIGLILIIIGFTFLLIPSYTSTGKISVIWLLLFHLFLVLGELYIMPISYSLTSKLAPVKHSSLIMGALLAATSVGEILAGLFASAYPKPLAGPSYLFGFIPINSLSSFIWIFIIWTGTILIIWVLIRNKVKELSHGID